MWQRAYRIQAASSEKALAVGSADRWESGWHTRFSAVFPISLKKPFL
jgi:hypothetical protein